MFLSQAPHPPGASHMLPWLTCLGSSPLPWTRGRDQQSLEHYPLSVGEVILQREIRALLAGEAGVDSGQPKQQMYTSLWTKKATLNRRVQALSIQSWLPSFPCFRLPGFPLDHVAGTFKGYKAAQLEISMGTICLIGQYFLIVPIVLVSYLCLRLFLRHGNQDTLIWCLMYQ